MAPSITTRSRGWLMSHMHFHTLTMQPGSEVFLALVKLHRGLPEPTVPTVAPPNLPPEIIPIVKEFADVVPTSLPAGLPPDHGNSMKIETDPYADPPVCPVV